MFNCCWHENLLHFSHPRSHSNICYYHQDLCTWRLHIGSRQILQRTPCYLPTHWGFKTKAFLRMLVDFAPAAMYRQTTWAPSILRANCFGRWVVTHSLADDNFHVHRPAVFSNQHLSWYMWCVVYLGALTLRLVHPTAPVLLTKTWPTGRIQSGICCSEEQH